MSNKKQSDKKSKSDRSVAGTHGVAPLGYIEVAGSREALQRAAEEITRLKKEIRSLRRHHENTIKNLNTEASGSSWDYSHLEEAEKIVIQAYLRGDFHKDSIRAVCHLLSNKHGKSENTYKRAYQRLLQYGTFLLISPQIIDK